MSFFVIFCSYFLSQVERSELAEELSTAYSREYDLPPPQAVKLTKPIKHYLVSWLDFFSDWILERSVDLASQARHQEVKRHGAQFEVRHLLLLAQLTDTQLPHGE
jgi:hypothetical protein